MSVIVQGHPGAGLTTVYNAPSNEAVVVETLKFQIDTDGTAGIHRVRIRLVDPVLDSFATLDDLNDGGASQTNFYTYGLGLNASACTMATGWAVTDALPWTEMSEGGSLTIMPMDDSGVVISGDQISNVVLKVSSVPGQGNFTLQQILEMPGSVLA